MDIITYKQLRGLIEGSTAPCVSIFMPTHRVGRDVRQDPAHLKNLLRDAEEKLTATGMRPTLARDLLKPAQDLVEDADFWMHSQNGLAIFICKGVFHRYRIPVEVDDVCTVNDRFEIKPLLPLLQSKLFYILAVSQNDARLLECTPTSCVRRELPKDVALSVIDTQGSGENHKSDSIRHGGDASRAYTGPGGFHGQATDVQNKEQEDRRFFYRQLDEGMMRTIRDPAASLVVAGTESTAPYYKHVSSHKHITEQCIHGNPEHVTDEALHKGGVEILEPLWQKETDELREQYGTAYAHQLASDNINQIVPAAAQGRVGILFVAPQNRHPGKFDAQNQMVDDRSDSEDLVDIASINTLMTGGQLVVVNPEDVPGRGEVAAIYRYMA